MNWLINRARQNRERLHQEKVQQLERENWQRMRAVEEKYQQQDYFAVPETILPEEVVGFLPDAREAYLYYILNRVGISFIPKEALLLARKFGPAMAADRVCKVLGLDYSKISVVAPRIASETSRATIYFEEMKQWSEATGINADSMLPHIHFGSHDTRDSLFENFRTAARVLELYENFHPATLEYIGWPEKSVIFQQQWIEITSECLVRFYEQGNILLEYQRVIDQGSQLLEVHVDQLKNKWVRDEKYLNQWQQQFPTFKIIKRLIHISNIIRKLDTPTAKEWNRQLKKVNDTQFDFDIIMAGELFMEDEEG